MVTEHRIGLAALLEKAVALIETPTVGQASYLAQLSDLHRRLVGNRFQLAVLGQFKRGKSTLLNALLGEEVLPTAVVPLTAIPTFLIAGASRRIVATYRGGRVEETEAANAEALRTSLAELVTEDANPENRKEVTRVEAYLPSPLLACGVVLVDTPGVGSTFRHNTDAANAVLPECDAALFVVSPDPPITEVEIEYLHRIQETVGRVVVILNKIDTVSLDDRTLSLSFLKQTLDAQRDLEPLERIFCLSAKNGLRAKRTGDDNMLSESGLAALETYLQDFLARDKRAVLEDAVARKARTILQALQLKTAIEMQALRLPLDDLRQRLETFGEALEQFEAERQSAQDMLAGDRRRLLDGLDERANEIRSRGRALLQGLADRAFARGGSGGEAESAIAAALPDFFDAELREAAAAFQMQIATVLGAHQRRADALIDHVRQTASNLMDIDVSAPDSSEVFVTKRKPYWITKGRGETLNPVPPGAFDRILPFRFRQIRARRRVREEIDAVLVRNVENLRWAMRQNADDAFRDFGTTLDERLRDSIELTQGAMREALNRRQEQTGHAEQAIDACRRRLAGLADIQSGLSMFA
jgi:GTP-binding protein EngB required for normal cell division